MRIETERDAPVSLNGFQKIRPVPVPACYVSTGMPKETIYEVTTVARATEQARKNRAARRAIIRIQKLCMKALAAKKPADFQSTVAALRVAVRALLKNNGTPWDIRKLDGIRTRRNGSVWRVGVRPITQGKMTHAWKSKTSIASRRHLKRKNHGPS